MVVQYYTTALGSDVLRWLRGYTQLSRVGGTGTNSY